MGQQIYTTCCLIKQQIIHICCFIRQQSGCFDSVFGHRHADFARETWAAAGRAGRRVFWTATYFAGCACKGARLSCLHAVGLCRQSTPFSRFIEPEFHNCRSWPVWRRLSTRLVRPGSGGERGLTSSEAPSQGPRREHVLLQSDHVQPGFKQMWHGAPSPKSKLLFVVARELLTDSLS